MNTQRYESRTLAWQTLAILYLNNEQILFAKPIKPFKLLLFTLILKPIKLSKINHTHTHNLSPTKTN